MLWDHDIPRVRHTDAAGHSTVVTVIAGSLDAQEPPAPPPHSWASRSEAEVAIWHLHLEAGATWTLPAAADAELTRMLYLFDGDGLTVAGHRLAASTGAALAADQAVDLVADGPVDALVLQGRPLQEPVARYGPFVMNTRAEIEQAIADFQRTGFGGWPWPADDPVHGTDPARFARHSDGHLEHADATAALDADRDGSPTPQ